MAKRPEKVMVTVRADKGEVRAFDRWCKAGGMSREEGVRSKMADAARSEKRTRKRAAAADKPD